MDGELSKPFLKENSTGSDSLFESDGDGSGHDQRGRNSRNSGYHEDCHRGGDSLANEMVPRRDMEDFSGDINLFKTTPHQNRSWRNLGRRAQRAVRQNFASLKQLLAPHHHSIPQSRRTRGIYKLVSHEGDLPLPSSDHFRRSLAFCENEAPLHNYESYDYDEHHSLVRRIKVRSQTEFSKQSAMVTKWVLTFIIAMFVAFIAVIIQISTFSIIDAKFSVMQKMIDSKSPLTAYLFFCGLNASLALIAACIVALWEPMSIGSGIPEIKCTLNGLKLPRIVRIKTLFAKVIGIIFSVSSGLPVGAEGPMIHSGAVCGAGISQGKSTSFALSSSFKYFKPFRNDRAKRDFISCGAAAGVACAFGAPIGGVLFALEEGSSFWNIDLTWRTFFCAMSSTFMWGIIWVQVRHSAETFHESEIFVFGDVSASRHHSSIFSLVDLLFFIAIGALGGLFGALYNKMNKSLSKQRMRHLKSSRSKIAEVLFISLVVSNIVFALPLIIGTCKNLESSHSKLSFVRFTCKDGEYHDLGTLLFTQSHLTIKHLLHSDEDFSYSTLSTVCVSFFFLSCWTYGSSIPSGLFVPNLLTGAALGRIVGQLLKDCAFIDHIDVGTYALVGAAAVLGGMARMTISLTVIIIEATGDLTHGLPIMVTLLVSKWVGDFFNEGLYDIHIHLKQYDFLGWFPPHISNYLLAMDVMHTSIKVLDEVEKVSTIYEILKNCTHNGFPVVSGKTMVFRGLMLRKHLCMILFHRRFFKMKPVPYKTRHLLDYDDLEEIYPRFKDIESIQLEPSDMDSWIDLTPYMNPSPFVIQEHSPVTQVFNIFRTMGLRHLTIVNKSNQAVGMITRKDLTDVRFRKQLQVILDSEKNHV